MDTSIQPKDLHIGNWYYKVHKPCKSEPIEIPIQLTEEDFVEIFGNKDRYSLCIDYLSPIYISKDVVESIPEFTLVEDKGNHLSWYEYRGPCKVMCSTSPVEE